MKTILEHIEHVKGKPHHIRKKVAFGAASFGTAFIALVWFAGELSTGAFAIHGTSFAESTGQEPTIVAGTSEQGQSLAGAAAALPQDGQSSGNNSGPARIEIVNSTSSASGAPSESDRTIIPF